MSITVSKTVYSFMKRDVENKKKKIAKDQAKLKQLEATFKSMKIAK